VKRSGLMMQVQQKFKALAKRVQRELRAFGQRHPDVMFCQRCKIIMNMVKGHLLNSIHQHLGCSYSTVQRVAHRFIRDGFAGLVDRREDNGETKITEEHEAFLLLAAAGSPRDHGFDRPTWTLELFVAVLFQQEEVQVSTSTMSRTLARLKIRCKSPKPFVLCPWETRKRSRRLNKIAGLLETVPRDEVILYVDEVDIHLNPKIGLDWMPCGVQKTVLTPGQNKKRYLAGAFNPRSGRLTYVESDRKDSDLFIDQLWTLVLKDYPKAKRIHIILDNYRIHSSQRTKIALAALADKVTLHFLPPYCPDHNKIERTWKDLHANVTRNHRCSSMDELMAEVRKYLKTRDQQLQHKYATQNLEAAA